MAAPGDRPVLSIEDVSLVYRTGDGPVAALERLTFTMTEGEFVCVVGPSGCGKTTLLKIIAGFLAPTSGRVLLDGVPIREPDHQRGVVFQHPALYPWLTVLENIEFGPKMRGIGRAERRRLAERYLQMVRLEDFGAKPPYQLSGGMQQRVAIARVLANDPRILLMDEPFGALDALTREHMQEELLKIWKATGKTVFLITHSVEEACYLATSILVMSPRPGRIVRVLDAPFSRRAGYGDSRGIKASPEFVALREQVLTLIWAEE